MSRRGPHVRELFDLSGQVALITGGAQNLGLDMAEALGDAGADLVITSRDLSKSEAAAERLRAHCGVRVLPLGVDVTAAKSVADGFARLLDEYGQLDICVCNAGGARLTEGGATIDERSVNDWDYTVTLNLRGTFLVVQQAARAMKPRGRGAIITIGSISGLVGRDRWVYEGSDMVPNMTDYSAGKGGIIALTRDLAAELGPFGVRVNCLSPGGFERGQPEEFIRRYSKQTPLGRMGRDGVDLKGAIVFLASEAAAYVTGINLPVDGGFTAW